MVDERIYQLGQATTVTDTSFFANEDSSNSNVTEKISALQLSGYVQQKIPQTSTYTAIFVNNIGSDVSGNGSLLKPYQTVAHAHSVISDATINKQYMICQQGAITETSPVVLKPWIHMQSDGSPWYVSAISLDASFQTENDFWMKYQNLSFASDATFNLLFTDASLKFGCLNFINCSSTRMGNPTTPTITINVNSPQGYHHFNFNDCIFSEANDGDFISIVCAGLSPLDWNGGNLPHIIDYSAATSGGSWINIANAVCSGSTTTISIANQNLYLSTISDIYGELAIHCGNNNNCWYDSSINDTGVFTVTGTGNSFFPFTVGNAIRPNYTPTNYTIPSPGIFQSTQTLYDHLNGIDNKLSSIGPSWTDVTASPQALADNNGYIADLGSLLTFTLPTICAIGTTFIIVGKGAGGWIITQSASQLIHIGSSVSTTGSGGSVASSNRYDCITLTCITANLEFSAYAIQGNLTII